LSDSRLTPVVTIASLFLGYTSLLGILPARIIRHSETPYHYCTLLRPILGGTDDSETAYWQGICNGRVSVRLSVRQSVRQSVPSIDRWSQSDEKFCDSQVSVVTFSGGVGKWFTFCFLLR